MQQVENIIYPVLLHSLTVDGLDAIEEGIDCITIIAYYAYKQTPISHNMWKLFPQLLYVCAGSEENKEGGFGLEYVNQIVPALKNFISRDPNGMMAVGENQDMTHLDLTMLFIRRILEINRNGSDMCDGVSVINLLIALLENMEGKLNEKLPELIGMLAGELAFLNTQGSNGKNFKVMLLQAISMCFSYNATLTFQILEQQNLTLNVFQAWFVSMNDFKKDFEIRRVIFGLTSIIKTSPLPELVNQKLPDIMNQLTLLCAKMSSERLEVLKDNEKFIAKDGKESDSEEEDDEAIDADGDDDFAEDSEEEWKKQ